MSKNKPIQLSIPQPCSEDWNKMTPQEQGRFCDSCQKCVVDFTNFNDHQLYDYIQAHKGEKVCGRFQNTQLNRTLQIPPQPHSRLYRIAIAVGLTLAIIGTAEVHSFAKAPFVEYSFLDKPQEDSTTNNSDSTIIKGRVCNHNGEPAVNATVQLLVHGRVKGGTVTDYDGNYQIKIESRKGIGSLKYNYFGAKIHTVESVPLNSATTLFMDILLEKNPKHKQDEYLIMGYTVPVIDRDNPSPMNKTISGEEINRMAH